MDLPFHRKSQLKIAPAVDADVDDDNNDGILTRKWRSDAGATGHERTQTHIVVVAVRRPMLASLLERARARAEPNIASSLFNKTIIIALHHRVRSA